jgi:hypothetical protein
MGNFIDLTGRKFYKLTVIRLSHHKNKQIYWLCKCDCGSETTVYGYSLRKGKSRSCGCYQHGEVAMPGTGIHGHTRGYSMTAEYRAWSGMKSRCRNPKNPLYHSYGARGIDVCESWYTSFNDFVNYVGLIPQDGKKYSLDRIDNDKGYEPGNVRWTDQYAQANNKRTSVMITAFGKTMSLAQWAREVKLPINTLRNRRLAKWSPERMLTEPVNHIGNRSWEYDWFKLQHDEHLTTD